MSESGGDLEMALKAGEGRAEILKETLPRRRKMRDYFWQESRRLGLKAVSPRETKPSSSGPSYVSSQELKGILDGPDFQSALKGNEINRKANIPVKYRDPGSLVTSLDLEKVDLADIPVNILDEDLLDSSAQRYRFRSIHPREEFGNAVLAVYGGYFLDRGNTRAEVSGLNMAKFNERFLTIPETEMERMISHELWHIKTRSEVIRGLEEGGGYLPEEHYLFLFHDSFDDLFQRMEFHFEHHSGNKYPFEKELNKPTWENKGSPSNYVGYDELIALLGGYEVYLEQKKKLKESGVSPGEIEAQLACQPYEFIEAFQETDLKLLDPEHRHRLAQEVLAENPIITDLVARDKDNAVEISMNDL